MFKQSTRAALLVFSLVGGARHGVIFGAHGGGGVGFPPVRCRLTDQYGRMGEDSGRVATEPPLWPGSWNPFSSPSFLVREDDGSEWEVER